jgi:hypothetical protein
MDLDLVQDPTIKRCRSLFAYCTWILITVTIYVESVNIGFLFCKECLVTVVLKPILYTVLFFLVKIK